MTVFYPVPEVFPDPRARFIQVMNTAAALGGAGLEVVLLVGKAPGATVEDIRAFYGVEAAGSLDIKPLPMLRKGQSRVFRFSWHGVFNHFLRRYLSGSLRDGDVVFVRHLKLADTLLQFLDDRGVPLVFEVHEIFHRNVDSAEKRRVLEDLERRVYNRASLVIVLAESLADDIVRLFGVDPARVVVVPHGVGAECFSSGTAPGRGGYVCYAGSLYRWKGVDVAIKAMRHLPGVRLRVVGGGDRLDELKALAADEGVADRVEFTGPVGPGRVKEHLAGASVALLPNILEGPSVSSSPLKLFEYMAAGVPVVASDMDGLRAVLKHERNAILVEPGDEKALAEGIRRVIEDKDLSARLAAGGRECAEEYTYEKRGERIALALKELGGKSR